MSWYRGKHTSVRNTHLQNIVPSTSITHKDESFLLEGKEKKPLYLSRLLRHYPVSRWANMKNIFVALTLFCSNSLTPRTIKRSLCGFVSTLSYFSNYQKVLLGLPGYSPDSTFLILSLAGLTSRNVLIVTQKVAKAAGLFSGEKSFLLLVKASMSQWRGLISSY